MTCPVNGREGGLGGRNGSGSLPHYPENAQTPLEARETACHAERNELAVFGATIVARTPTGSHTTLPCGAEIPATPHDTDAYRITARLNGYGADRTALCQERDLTHVALCAWLGLAVSPTLQAVADGREFQHAGLEEDAVLAVQRFARALVWIFGKYSRKVENKIMKNRQIVMTCYVRDGEPCMAITEFPVKPDLADDADLTTPTVVVGGVTRQAAAAVAYSLLRDGPGEAIQIPEGMCFTFTHPDGRVLRWPPFLKNK